MKTLKMWITTGYAGVGYEEEIEVPDDYTSRQCEEECKVFLHNNIEYGWELLDA